LEVAGEAHWENFNEVLRTYASANQVGSCLVFNVRGNNYRLICGVAYANRWVKGTKCRWPDVAGTEIVFEPLIVLGDRL